MRKTTVSSLIASALLVTSSPLLAGEFIVGGGAVSFKSPYKDFKDNNSAYLLAEYEGENFSVGSEGVNYRLLGDDESPFSLYATLDSVGMGFDSSDSTFFSGMAERDSSFDLGLSADYQLADSVISASVLHDISGAHKGFTADLSYSYLVPLGEHAMFVPMVGVNYLSEEFTDYYFGVRTSEATAGRAAYKADATANTYVGYSLDMPLNESWSINHSASYIWLGDEITDSSLVERDTSWFASLGVEYRF